MKPETVDAIHDMTLKARALQMTEISEQIGPHVVIEARCHGVVARFGRAGVSAGGARGIETRPTGDQPKRSGGYHAKVLQRVPPENV